MHLRLFALQIAHCTAPFGRPIFFLGGGAEGAARSCCSASFSPAPESTAGRSESGGMIALCFNGVCTFPLSRRCGIARTCCGSLLNGQWHLVTSRVAHQSCGKVPRGYGAQQMVPPDLASGSGCSARTCGGRAVLASKMTASRSRCEIRSYHVRISKYGP